MQDVISSPSSGSWITKICFFSLYHNWVPEFIPLAGVHTHTHTHMLSHQCTDVFQGTIWLTSQHSFHPIFISASHCKPRSLTLTGFGFVMSTNSIPYIFMGWLGWVSSQKYYLLVSHLFEKVHGKIFSLLVWILPCLDLSLGTTADITIPIWWGHWGLEAKEKTSEPLTSWATVIHV